MKIIIRDVFSTFFPKYFTTYQSIRRQQNQLEIEKEKKQLAIQQQSVGQLKVPEFLGNRRSSTLSKGKNSKLALTRNKSKEQNVENKNIIIKTSGQSIEKVMTMAEKQRVSEVLSEKLEAEIRDFILNHRFYSNAINILTLMNNIQFLLLKCLLSAPSKPHSRNQSSISTSTSSQFITQNLFKLSLYLNKQTNKQIFTVYEHILSNPRNGISYETLSRKLKTDIINVSHYCCKLKKMRFIDWEHKKQGIVVFPKATQKTTKASQNKDHFQSNKVNLNVQDKQQSFSYENSFLFNQLSLNQNILVNLCSATSLSQGGLTNEEIKFKIMKHAQNKMVRRTVEGMRHVEKNAERQGKVFQFKYKKETQKVTKQMDKKRTDTIGKLTQKCRQFLNTNFIITIENKTLKNEQLLQHIVNTKLTDYYSSIGIKQSKRQCTPLKLNRYISILNYLQIEGSQTQLDLRRHIIEIQKDLESYQGIIHKRSVIGILEGLKKIGLIQEIDGWFYPAWCQVEKKQKKQLKKLSLKDFQDEDISHILSQGVNGNKRRKMDKLSKAKSKKMIIPPDQIRMITKKQHLNEIFTELLSITFQKALKRTLRKAFHRIIYVQRKKQSIPMFEPEKNIFHLIQNQELFSEKWKSNAQPPTTIESFMSHVNDFIEEQGRRIEGFPEIEYDIVKYVRRNPMKMVDSLRSKYGKGWSQKFEPLQKAGVIRLNQSGYETLQSFNGYLA